MIDDGEMAGTGSLGRPGSGSGLAGGQQGIVSLAGGGLGDTCGLGSIGSKNSTLLRHAVSNALHQQQQQQQEQVGTHEQGEERGLSSTGRSVKEAISQQQQQMAGTVTVTRSGGDIEVSSGLFSVDGGAADMDEEEAGLLLNRPCTGKLTSS